MKKIKRYFCAVGIAGLLAMCACGSTPNESRTGSGSAATDSDVRASVETESKSGGGASEASGLVPLSMDGTAHCNTEDGYYYITEDTTELRDGTYGSHLMYMDFATQQEIYLCSDTGCSHDDESCPSVLGGDEFQWGSSRIFIWNDNLYILSKENDDDGSVSIQYMGGEQPDAESEPAALYRMNLDGTDRKKIFTFEDGMTLEDCVFADSDSIYFVSKKLETNVERSVSVTDSTDRNVIRFTPADGSLETVQSLDPDDGIKWQVAGCYDRSLVLSGIIYPEGFSDSPDVDDDAWRDAYLDSRTVYATLDLKDGKLTQVYQTENQDMHSCANRDGILYLSSENSGEIEKIDLRTGQQSALAQLPQSNIIGSLSDALICRSWDMTDDYTLYFVDTADGTVSHCGLTNQYNGWALDVMGETRDDAIVIYDYDAEANPDDSYEIYQYKFALIAKPDLYAGTDRFRPIQMTGKGI